MSRRSLFRLLVVFSLVWLGWAGWSMIGRTHQYDLRVLDDLGDPVASAIVDSGGTQLGTTGANGIVQLTWRSDTSVLQVSAPGHVPQVVTLADRPEEQFDVVLKARVLRGRVVDAEGAGLPGATVIAGSARSTTDASGHFQIRGAEEGTIRVERPAWLPTTFEWDGGQGDAMVAMEPFTARAVHIGGLQVRDELDYYVDMAMDTELNALMIDLKDESGYVFFNTTTRTATEAGAALDSYDLAATVSMARERGLYVIGRIVLFNDPVAAVSLPEIAVWDTSSNQPYEANGQFFLDPTDPDARQYGLDLAREACAAGVDEVQFDYVRFPDKRTEAARFDGGVSPDIRVSTISNFLASAVDSLRPMGCAVAADIFGYLTTARDDGGIGQVWEEVAGIVDVVSPMLYPSHYDDGWYGFEDPDAYPGEMIDRALVDGMERLDNSVVIRPWLQDFAYGPGDVRAQIEAAERYGFGWMLWNAASNVTTDALGPAE